ncbi:putative RDD family membrane protein YckC [Haloactinospora alba]|uniref:Putative RDD family membrane protein YckC n=1 Tax=Haloactinospora alba TaxID=405555 RepID=A0A543NM37_9ACTN|nr:RDD family protein [Haloactinospora alba]TQN32896.1 putative RDD family membrane protein YckC [Haloactinospora alba]
MASPSWNNPPPGYDYPGGYGYGGYGHPAGAPYGSPAAASQPLAEYGTRVCAYLLDCVFMLILMVVTSVLALGATMGLFYVLWPESFAGTGDEAMIPIIVSVIVMYPVMFGTAFCYRWIPHGRSGQTWGKRIMGIRLVKLETGQPPGLGSSFVRELLFQLLNMATCGAGNLLDLLWPLWDEPNRQTLHDKAVSTVVVAVR